MIVTELLHRRLVENQHWLMAEGSKLLGLDPDHERLATTTDRLMGVVLCLGKNERMPIAGLRLRALPLRDAPPLKIFDFEIDAIVHDEPAEAVDNAIHRLAIDRVWRRMGKEKPKPDYIRVPDVLLTFLRVRGLGADDAFGTITRSVDAGSRHFLRRVLEEACAPPSAPEMKLVKQRRMPLPGFHLCPTANAVEASSPRMPCDKIIHLDVRRSPGKQGHRYGRFYVSGRLPDMVVSEIMGRSFADVVSYPLTEPYNLRIVHCDVRRDTTVIGFDGADQLQSKSTLFVDAGAKALFNEEYAKLAPARDRLLEALSLDALPDAWWRRFKGHVAGRNASYFSPGTRWSANSIWCPRSPLVRDT